MLPVEHGLTAQGWVSVVYAKDQPEYLSLPALRSPDGQVITRWSLTWRERLQVLVSGCVWLTLLTFNKPLQPVSLSTLAPEFVEE